MYYALPCTNVKVFLQKTEKQNKCTNENVTTKNCCIDNQTRQSKIAATRFYKNNEITRNK